jgi:hypothetical protein
MDTQSVSPVHVRQDEPPDERRKDGGKHPAPRLLSDREKTIKYYVLDHLVLL